MLNFKKCTLEHIKFFILMYYFLILFGTCYEVVGHPKNSFLPSLTAVAGVTHTGNATIDHALQVAVSYHLQVPTLSTIQTTLPSPLHRPADSK
jgi:hypothetical protein